MAFVLALSMASALATAAEPPPQMARVSLWPSAFDGALAFPDEPGATGKTAEVLLKCRVRSDGRPIACSIHSETPKGFGFGKAAMKLRSKMRLVAPAPDQSPWVLVPFRWDGRKVLYFH